MKKIAMALSLFVLPSIAFASEAVFDEEVLLSWGYETTEISDAHAIKSLKNYGDDKEAFYARFYLKKSCYEGEAEALEEKKRVEDDINSTLMGRQKNFLRLIPDGKCLYHVKSYSTYIYQSHQPKLMEGIRAYLSH